MRQFSMEFAENEGQFSAGFEEDNTKLEIKDDPDLEAKVMDSIVFEFGEISIHNDLSGRGAENAHPISAITNLESELEDLRRRSVTQEEREYWNNKSRAYRNASGALVITY